MKLKKPGQEKKATLKHLCILRIGELKEIIHSLPMVNILSKTIKNRSITFIMKPEYAELLQYAKGIDQIFTFQPSWNFFHTISESKRLKNSIGFQVDTLINLEATSATKLFASQLKAKDYYEFTNKAEKKINPEEHLWMNFAKCYFHPQELKDYLDFYHLDEFFPLIRIPQQIIDLLSDRLGLLSDVKTIALIPGASNPALAWPLKNWVSFFKLLEQREERKYRILLIGEEKDITLCDDLIWELPGISKLKVSNLSGKLDWLSLGAILSKCDLVVGGDTDLLHLAAAVGSKVLGLFGPSSPVLNAPFTGAAIQAADYECAKTCSPKKCSRKILNCMESLSAEEVWLAMNEV